MTGGNFLHDLMVEQQRRIFGALKAQLAKRLRPKGRIRRDGDPLAVGQLDEGFLREVGVMLDLEGRGFDFGVAEEIEDQGAVEIADADAAGESGLDERFHCGPGFLDGGGTRHHVFFVVREAWGVPYRRIDVLQGDGKMHNVEVEVVDPPILKLLFANRFNTFLVMERVPQLGYEKELLTLDEAFFKGLRNALAAFYLVPVILTTRRRSAIGDLSHYDFPLLTTGAVKQAVADLDGIVDLISTCVILHLP